MTRRSRESALGLQPQQAMLTTTTTPRQIDVEALPALGWVRIVHQGEENTYVETEDGRTFCFKL